MKKINTYGLQCPECLEELHNCKCFIVKSPYSEAKPFKAVDEKPMTTIEQSARLYSKKSDMLPYGTVSIWELNAYKAGFTAANQHTIEVIEGRIKELRELATDSGFHHIYDRKREELEHLLTLLK